MNLGPFFAWVDRHELTLAYVGVGLIILVVGLIVLVGTR